VAGLQCSFIICKDLKLRKCQDRKQWQELKDLKYKWSGKRSVESGILVSSFTRWRSAVTCASAPAAERRKKVMCQRIKVCWQEMYSEVKKASHPVYRDISAEVTFLGQFKPELAMRI
jgi:hypothetical protein